MKKLVRQGKVLAGGLIFPAPLPLPEGTEVAVEIQPTRKPQKKKTISNEEFLALPFFGMWADREEMKDSVAWVQKERRKWRQRSQRKD